MKRIDVLKWGLRHIASNYKMGASVDDIEETGDCCIYVTEDHPKVTSAPINDVQLLCQDLGIKRDDIEVDSFGISIYAAYYLHSNKALYEDYVPTGHEFWKKSNVNIGE